MGLLSVTELMGKGALLIVINSTNVVKSSSEEEQRALVHSFCSCIHLFINTFPSQIVMSKFLSWEPCGVSWMDSGLC